MTEHGVRRRAEWSRTPWPAHHFCIGALAGVVAARIYQTITRGLEKYAERVVAKNTPTNPPSS